MMVAPSDVIVTASGRPAWQEAIENNWYEASRWSPHRSWIWQPVQDARKDLDRFTRYELVKHCRYLHKNSPLIRGLVERIVNLTIGSGIHPVPISSKADWNKRAKARWKVIGRAPCVDSRMHMGQYQRIKARERVVDGGGFTLLTYSKRTFQNKIQGIEADRVTSAEGAVDSAERNVDGVILDDQGMPVLYKVRGVETPYPAENVVHHFTPTRSSQWREEPLLAAAINQSRDVDDILALEKQAVKDASGHTDIIKTKTGEIDPEQLRKLRLGTQYPTTMSLPQDKKTRQDWYRVAFGSEAIVLQDGDEYSPYVPQRPGAAWQGFMDYLANTICLSTGLPPSILLPVNVGGTDIRRDLELAQRIVSNWQEDLAHEWQQIWEYFMLADIEDGPLQDAPDDWNLVRWQFPKSITVDRGRDAQQDRADCQAGQMSHEEYHGRYGDDGEEYDLAVEMEVRRRRLRLFGTPLDQPFKDMREFVEILSMDARLFASAPDSEEGSNSPEDNAPALAKPPKKAHRGSLAGD